jgi:hypothetical protein
VLDENIQDLALESRTLIQSWRVDDTLCEENADAVEHHLDVFVQSGAEEEEEDGNWYVTAWDKHRLFFVGEYGTTENLMKSMATTLRRAVPKLVSLSPTLTEALIEIEGTIQRIHQNQWTIVMTRSIDHRDRSIAIQLGLENPV